VALEQIDKLFDRPKRERSIDELTSRFYAR